MEKNQFLELLSKGVGVKEIDAAELANLPSWCRDLYVAARYINQGALDDAESVLTRATLTAPKEWLTHFFLAKLFVKKGLGRKAVVAAKRAFELSKSRTDATLLYVHTMLDTGEVDEVIKLVERIHPEQRKQRPLLMALASAYRSKGEFENALKYVDSLLDLYPDNPTGVRLKGDILADRDSAEGVVFYERSIAIQKRDRGSVDAATRWNSSLHYLRLRRFDPGWAYWDAGFSADVGTMGRLLPEQVKFQNRVLLEPIDPERWILVTPEQGIGDQVLFLSGFKELRKESQRILMVADHRLYNILKRSFPDTLIGYPGIIDGWDSNSLKKQGVLPLGSILPRYRASTDDFLRSRHTFLQPDPEKVAKYRRILERRSDGKAIVGISWVGGYWDQQKRTKRIALDDWESLFESDAMVVNLQYGDVQADLEIVGKRKWRMIHFKDLDFKEQIEEWHALMCACDRIVSVSTALVHFAAASGQKVDILMPARQGPWILGMSDVDHIAYLNTKIHRNHQELPPKVFIQNVIQELSI